MGGAGQKFAPDAPKVGESRKGSAEPVEQIVVVGSDTEDEIKSISDDGRGSELADHVDEGGSSSVWR